MYIQSGYTPCDSLCIQDARVLLSNDHGDIDILRQPDRGTEVTHQSDQ